MKLLNDPISSLKEVPLQNNFGTVFYETYPDILYFEEKKPILIILGDNSLEIVKKLEKIEKLIKNR